MLKLQEEGYEVSIAYFTGNIFPFTKKINGVTKRFWPITKPLIKKRQGWRKQHSLFHYWNSFFNPPDLTIINMSGNGSSYCFKLANVLLKKQKPYIAMIGSMYVSTDKETMDYFAHAAHIIVHTNLQKANLKEITAFKSLDIKVMPLGVDTAFFTPKLDIVKRSELLFVGRITRLKQIELAIHAAHKIIIEGQQLTCLNIVGPISDSEYFEELKELVNKLQLQDYVIFRGAIKQEELLPFYQNAYLLLLPSKHESFGMVMIEAMACGTPVAALIGSGGPDEIVVDGYNGILATKKTYTLRVFEYMQSKDRQQVLQKNARVSIEDKWSLCHTEEALRTSIKQVFR